MNIKFYMPEFETEQEFCEYFFRPTQICDKYRNAKGKLEFKSADEFDAFMDELGFEKVRGSLGEPVMDFKVRFDVGDNI